jgi:hypothetical protein
VPSRRALLAGLSGVALGSAAGCVTDLTDTATASESFALGENRLAFRDGFESEAVELRRKYGDRGVWGLDGPRSPPLGPDTEYLGAAVRQLAVTEEHGGRPFALAHGAALSYRMGERRRVWLWLAARAQQVDGTLGRTNLSQLAVETEPGPGWELTAATPRGPTREGPVTVSLDERGPGATVPLERGGLAADTFELGPDGRVEVAWQGITGGTRVVHALVEYASTGGDEPFASPVSFRVAAARGVL